MPDPASDADAMQRYQAIEQAYCDSRWREVLREGERLLDGVRRGDVENAEGLEDRLQLLLGHTHLYGFGDRDAAEDHYSAVLASRADASLRQIAQEGLDQCNLPRATAGDSVAEEPDGPEPTQPATMPPPLELPFQEQAQSLAEEPASLDPTAMPGSTAPSTAMPAMPWQSDATAAEVPTAAAEPPFGMGSAPVSSTVDAAAAATPWLITSPAPVPAPEPMPEPAMQEAAMQEAPLPRLQPEVLEEPEQIEVHQAMPELADEHVLEPIEPVELAWAQDGPAVAEPEVAPEAPLSVPTPAPAAEEDPELMRGLLRIEIR